jgi:hypothetical protein
MDITWQNWSRGMRPHGLVCGVLITVWAVWLRGWDAPVPLIAVVLGTPYYALSGFLAGRRHSVDAGMVAGAATAATGYVIALAATMLYSAMTQSWDKPFLWLVLGTIFVLLPVLLGGFCGLLGAFVAKFARSTLDRWFAG